MRLDLRFRYKLIIRGLDECWGWIGSTSPKGYGRINQGGHDGRILVASRVAYELFHGPIPDGLFVLHSCDNPPCCNPCHLFLGTNGDNIRDMFAKGRGNRTTQPKGSDHGRARLVEEQVIEMRQLWGTGAYTLRQLSERYQVGISNIHTVVNRQTWQHV